MDEAKKKDPNFLKNIKKGAFHKALGKEEDAEITPSDIKKGLHSEDPHEVKMANFARNAKKWKHKGKVAEAVDADAPAQRAFENHVTCGSCGAKVSTKNMSANTRMKAVCPSCGEALNPHTPRKMAEAVDADRGAERTFEKHVTCGSCGAKVSTKNMSANTRMKAKCPSCGAALNPHIGKQENVLNRLGNFLSEKKNICSKCNKPMKENTEGNTKYCQGH